MLASVTGPIGRAALEFTVQAGRVVLLLRETAGHVLFAPRRERREQRRQLGRLAVTIGNRSLVIVALTNALIGAILVLQTSELLRRYGQLPLISGVVAVSMTRELGPLMTAIIFIMRVGSAFTASLGLMKANEEILALETMGIPPTSYLVAPRMVAAWIMLPCLAIFANAVGILGGCLTAWLKFDLGIERYLRDTADFLVLRDLWAGVVKTWLFATVITTISCHMGLSVKEGSEGLMRNTMLSSVACLVAVVVTDLVFTGMLQWIP